jgi:hypothetical protein
MPLFKNFPLFNNRKTRNVQIILRNESRSKSKSKSKSRSNSFTRKRKLIATRFVSKLNTYKSKVLERSNKSRALTQKLKTKLNSAIHTIKKSDDCPICLSKIDLKEPITTLKCGHTLHSRCLYNYVNNTQDVDLRCPSCREPIKLTSLDRSKLKEELVFKFQYDASEENVEIARNMWTEASDYVTELNQEIADNSDNPTLVEHKRRHLEKAIQASEEALTMYIKAVDFSIIEKDRYSTYKYITELNNAHQTTTHQIV